MGKEALTLRGVSKYYTSAQSVVMGMNNISLTFHVGEFVAVTGESGSGKSTLAKVMAGILPYESGEMLLFGRPTSHYGGADWERYRSDSISFISQSYDILPGCTVLLNVVSALRLTGMEKKAAAVKAEEILKEVELWEMKNRRAAKLSSGQKQRLSIARALAKPAPILIADEPTGNLDKENSDKVIALLRAAAKDRLVVIITHEFGEVADHATRHITLHDGIVSSDLTLRDYADTQDTAPVTKRVSPKGLSRYTALLQMGSRPVWSAIMLLFFSLTAFAVFAFFGTFLVNLDDTSTRVYDNSAFRNGDKERIVVIRPDGGAFAQEDIAALSTVSHVTSIEKWGLLVDINFYYREDIDYARRFTAVGGTPIMDPTHVETNLLFANTGLFLQTVPAEQDKGAFLTAGRLPENMYEVVAGDEALLDQTITVYIQDKKNWATSAYIALSVTVVGTTDYDAHLYFHEQLGRSLTDLILYNGALVLPNYQDDLGDTFRSSQQLHSQLLRYSEIVGIRFDGTPKMGNWLKSVAEGGFMISARGDVEGELLLALNGTHAYKVTHSIEVSPEVYDKLVAKESSPQVCLFIEDYAYTDAVLKEVRQLGYGCLSPYQLSSNRQNESRAAERMQTLKVCLLALIAVLALKVVVLRALFSMEVEEYRLLSNLGLRRKTARRSVLWQILLFSLGGETLAVIAVAVCRHLEVNRIVNILRYLPAPNMLLTWLVHIVAGLIAAAWIMRAVSRQVYPATGGRLDLSMEDINKEVEA